MTERKTLQSRQGETKMSGEKEEAKGNTNKEELPIATAKPAEAIPESGKPAETKDEPSIPMKTENGSPKKEGTETVYPPKGVVIDFIDHIQNILDYQTSNGLIKQSEAKDIQKGIEKATTMLKTDLIQATASAQNAYFDLVDKINSKENYRKRLIYMYGIHIWTYLIALTVALLIVIASQVLKFSLLSDVSADVIIWGGLGGCAFAFYHLRQSISQFKLSKYYSVFWILYPLAGMIFGLSIAIVISAGLLSLQAKPTYPVYSAIAFLAGTFQLWIFTTLKDIAESIHKTEQSKKTAL